MGSGGDAEEARPVGMQRRLGRRGCRGGSAGGGDEIGEGGQVVGMGR